MATHITSREHGTFRLTIELAESEITLSLHGELDTFCTDLLEDLGAPAPDVTCVRFDLADLSFIDTAGVRTLLDLEAACAATGREVRFEHAQPSVRRLFALVASRTLEDAN
jgi:anti-anti-sigma factor